MWMSLSLIAVGIFGLLRHPIRLQISVYTSVLLSFLSSLVALVLWSWLGFGDAVAVLLGVLAFVVARQRGSLTNLSAIALGAGLLLFFFGHAGTIQVLAAFPLGIALALLVFTYRDYEISSADLLLLLLALTLAGAAGIASRISLEVGVSREALVALPYFAFLFATLTALFVDGATGDSEVRVRREIGAVVLFAMLSVPYAALSAVYFSHFLPCVLGFAGAIASAVLERSPRANPLTGAAIAVVTLGASYLLHAEIAVVVWCLSWLLGAAVAGDVRSLLLEALTVATVAVGVSIDFLLGTWSMSVIWGVLGAGAFALLYPAMHRRAELRASLRSTATNNISELRVGGVITNSDLEKVQLPDVLAIIVPLLLGLIMAPGSFAGVVWGALMASLACVLASSFGGAGRLQGEMQRQGCAPMALSPALAHTVILSGYLAAWSLVVLWK
ncbi:MAG: hypothetical protein QY326_09315 [Bdellovibrionota bacterium]|nr:MAG: hypothetical protein QY326_09315 [Bdellovibrionota bacterium]